MLLYDWPHMVHGGDYNPDQWLDRPDILAEDIRLMKLAGVNSVTVGIFAWAALEPTEGNYNFEWMDKLLDSLQEAGIAVILATPSGARPAWMDKAHPECLRVTEKREQKLHGVRHNHCYTSPYYRQKVREMNALLAKRYGNHPAVKMWHLSNEYGGECHCPRCQEAFRQFLRERYHNDINELNKAWWTAFWSHTYTSFDEIESPSPLGEMQVHGHRLDWKRFVTRQTVSFIQNEAAPLKEIVPHIPTTVNLMTLYNVWDYEQLGDTVDVISWDNYPAWGNEGSDLTGQGHFIAFVHNYFRSMQQKPFLLMESTPSQVNWQRYNKLKRPGVHILSSLQAVAHGSDSVQYFQWRKSRGASEKYHGAVVDHYGKEDTRVFREVSKLGDLLKKLDCVCGKMPDAKAAILYDTENSWCISLFEGYIPPDERRYSGTCTSFYKPFWDRGIDCDVVNEEADFTKYKIVVAPMLHLLKPGTADRLKNFVRNGGRLILTYLTGYVNESDLCYLGGFPGDGLREVVGLRVEEADTLFPQDRNEAVFEENTLGISGTYPLRALCEIVIPEGCEVLAKYGQDFYAGAPVVTANRYGDGVCYYIAARDDGALAEQLCGALCIELNLGDNRIVLPAGVTASRRGEYLFLMNFTDATVTVKAKVPFVDILTEETEIDAISMAPYAVRVLKEI